MMIRILKKASVIALASVCVVASGGAIANYYDDNIDFTKEDIKGIQPFGANLFTGQFGQDKNDGINSEYIVLPGDEIEVSMWGLVSHNQTSKVDNQGNIFLPEIGPVKVGGAKNSDVTKIVRRKVETQYPSGVEVYTNLKGTKPLSVYVTGKVNKPGRYSGISSDSILHYLDTAQGINFDTGSFRDVKVMRNSKTIYNFDIYNFLLEGKIPNIQLKDNDTIFVSERKLHVIAEGNVNNKNSFEFKDGVAVGSKLMKFASPQVGVTNVSVAGFDNGMPDATYMSLDEFKSHQLKQGDIVTFVSSLQTDKIRVFIEGEHLGPEVIVSANDAKLLDVLNQIKIDPQLANYKSIKVERDEVAKQQKIALTNSLRRLEENALSASSYTTEDQKFKLEEAKLIQNFISNAKTVKPKGTIVVAENNEIKNIKLRNGDRIIIPPVTNIVIVSGEVTVPSAIVYNSSMSYKDYINKAGGYSLRADANNIIVKKANGSTMPIKKATIEQGDEIVVLPEIKGTTLSVVAKAMDIIYKLVLSVAVPINLFDD